MFPSASASYAVVQAEFGEKERVSSAVLQALVAPTAEPYQ